jgi:hypothetical protein
MEEWVDAQDSIAEAARILGLGENGRQRLWAYMRVGTGLGRYDELRASIITGIPYRAVVNGDDRVRDLFDPRLGDTYAGDPQLSLIKSHRGVRELNAGGGNAIRQLRIRDRVEPEALARFPAPSPKPTLRVQLREQEGRSTPWIPARLAWLSVRPTNPPSLLVEIDAILALEPPSSTRPEYRDQSTEELVRRVARKKQGNRAKGRPKLTKPEREARNHAIREARRLGAKHDQLAHDFDLSRSTVGKICNGLQPG